MPQEVFKYLVQPVLIERDDKANVVGESALEVVALYGRDQFNEFADRIEQGLASAAEPPQKPPRK